MNKNVFIDISTNNDLITKLSNDLYNKLNERRIKATLLPNTLSLNEKINRINQEGSNAITFTMQLNNQNVTEIIYPLAFNNTLPSLLNENLKTILNIAKYYQLRLPSDTSKDYYQIIRETPQSESIIIKFEPFNENLLNTIVNILSDTIADYLNKQNIYIVQKGDTLYSIARKLGITPNDIINANNLANYNLSIGQQLIIPIINKEQETPTNIPNGYTSYIVKSGDSLYQIAKRFNTTVEAIKKASNITSNNLSIGQTLLIPTETNTFPTPNTQTYIVKSGDSLYQIAKRFNTTVDAIKKASNITSNNLSIGQTLLIPTKTNTSPTPNTQTYTVKSGDSLYQIAKRFNTTVDAIKKASNITSNNLSIGQILIIP